MKFAPRRGQPVRERGGPSRTLLLTVVVISYLQARHAYPNGGGAYAVSRANLGQNAALIAAGARLIDYLLTVAVSVAAGVSNIVSAFSALAPTPSRCRRATVDACQRVRTEPFARARP